MLNDVIGRYHTIGHEVLELEAELGANDSHRETLDTLIDDARAQIFLKRQYTREEAVNILTTIGNLLKGKGFRYGTKFKLFHQGLEHKLINCESYDFIYLSIADALGLPLVAVDAPDHAFVRWVFADGNYLNWETTNKNELSDKEYIDWLNISPVAINNGAYLKNLTREAVIAFAYFKRGKFFEVSDNLDKAMEAFTEAVRLYPKFSVAYHRKGHIWYRKGNFDKAKEDFDEAIRLDPNDHNSYWARGLIWLKKSQPDESIRDFTSTIRLNPKDDSAYYGRYVAYLEKHNYILAGADFLRYKIPLLRRIPLLR